MQPTLSSFLLLLEPLSLQCALDQFADLLSLLEKGHGCTIYCIPEDIPSFSGVSYGEAEEKFLSGSHELLHFLLIECLANVNA